MHSKSPPQLSDDQYKQRSVIHLLYLFIIAAFCLCLPRCLTLPVSTVLSLLLFSHSFISPSLRSSLTRLSLDSSLQNSYRTNTSSVRL